MSHLNADAQRVRLQDAADVKWGDTQTTKAAYKPTGFLAYSASGPDGFMDHFDHEGPGIVLSAIGAQCGKTWYANGQWSCIKNTIYLKAKPEVADTRFLFYATSAPDFWPKRGAAQPFISQGDARRCELFLPPLQTQRRIASILGAYDDLIEINQRRIAKLEEMARALFDEWFVRFRFPGCENVPVINTPNGPLPEGWDRVNLGSFLSLHYGKALKADARVPETVAVIGSSGVVGWHDEAYVRGPGIVVGRKGNVGSVIWSPGDFWPIDTTYYVETGLPLTYVAELLRRVAFQNTDAAVPGLNRDYALSRKVIAPTASLVDRYGEFAAPVREQVDTLKATNVKLATSRDLLLPRLISGQFSVAAGERELEAAA